MSDPSTVMKMLKEDPDNPVQYVDFRFTDPRGKWQHVAQHIQTIDEEALVEGIMFDGSSIAGWKDINESDMNLKPDLSTAVMDPFSATPQLILTCDVLEPSTGQPYSRDPRSIAKNAEAYMRSTGIGDEAFFGPEAEFFVFDDARWKVGMHESFYCMDSEEARTALEPSSMRATWVTARA